MRAHFPLKDLKKIPQTLPPGLLNFVLQQTEVLHDVADSVVALQKVIYDLETPCAFSSILTTKMDRSSKGLAASQNIILIVLKRFIRTEQKYTFVSPQGYIC